MSADDNLITHPTTDLDHRVNAAYRRAVRRNTIQWVWVHEGTDTDGPPAGIVITDARPDLNAVAVSPEGWAMILAAGAEVPWEED